MKKTTTKKQVVEALINYLLEEGKPAKILKKVEGIAGNYHSFLITFNEGNNTYTNVRVVVDEPETYEVVEDEEIE